MPQALPKKAETASLAMRTALPDFDGDPAADTLTRRQKAAVVVHLLVTGGVDPGIRDLPQEQQRMLVRVMTELRFIDKPTLAAVVAEFAGELDAIGLHIPRDPAKLLAGLDGQLSMDVVEMLSAELGLSGTSGDNVWREAAEMPLEDILEMVNAESDEVCAIMLSKLPAERSAEIIAALPSQRADAVAAAFAATEYVTPDAVARIGTAIGRQAAARPPLAFASAPVARVAAILNAATSGVRRTLLDALDARDADFAARVRAAVFSFEDIPKRIDPRDIPKVLRAAGNDFIVAAIKALPAEQHKIGEFILGSISKRMAEQLREEITDRADVADEEAEEAMSAIVAAVRELEESGELSLNMEPEKAAD
ncbi:Flagellar motor switch protein FliG [Jannaschia seosinensis]|uniref:Flagellar motor switch protein FliG n=1 Tax=Jannaschia seosinensis TaxID=313367 RepID=A0A0M7B5R5_9RHOB|nr:FliG C-terminal domain-containing protein [Jannaschia seosinensis]CUH26440.1 Flagellar motor switch protein FliG [Jannaschia seosinensis]